ncbi:RimK/LysX family protein [Oleidesulfovibrio sp.]|uniref:ATP-dependent zinc protease family protein n=1 Tax=Oleidesulfovibrio sp. TaxID=2909707 RepID=UPI003A8A2551
MKRLFQLLFVILTLSLAACAPKQPVLEPAVPEQPAPVKPEAVQPEPVKPAPEPVKSAPEKPVVKPEPKPKPKPPQKPAEVKIDNLVLVGEAEYVYLADIKKRLPARIDTGATTSSLSAVNIQRFERDGKKWVRFAIPYPDGKLSEPIEKPLKRDARIKRHGAESIRRPIIMLRVRIGSINTVNEFSLTDRSKFKFPVLIGRSLLEGKAAVDVSREYITSPMSQ